jgi:hypothetical protein
VAPNDINKQITGSTFKVLRGIYEEEGEGQEVGRWGKCINI